MTYTQKDVGYGATASSSSAVWGQPVRHPCHMTRSELETFLERSDYGKNERMYACYFLPKDGTSGAPLCLTCGKPVGSHSNPITPATTSIFMPVALEPRSTPPRGFALCSDGATYELKCTPLRGLALAGGCNVIIALALLLAFGFTGLVAKAPVVIIGPTICCIVGFVLCCFVKKVAITISPLTQEVDVVQRRVVLPCCAVRHHFSFADVLVDQIKAQSSNVLVNGVPYATVSVGIRSPDGSATPVKVDTHFLPFLEAEEVAAEWLAFFAFYSRQ